MVKIKLLIGSTRPQRFGIQPANWIYGRAQQRTDAAFELVDLKEVNLPLFDEPQSPMTRNYTQEHTKAWSKVIGEADGFIFITPEYNYSTSAALKNAIDYLYHEWVYKPVSFVSYGSGGGGVRAVEHLRDIVAQVKMFDLREQVIITNYWEQMNDKGEFQPSDAQNKTADALLNELVFWTVQMKQSREELAKTKA
jgi:NAD(P)H-dependent FMN reductase